MGRKPKVSDELIRQKLHAMCSMGTIPTLNQAVAAVGGGDRGRISGILREVRAKQELLAREFDGAVGVAEPADGEAPNPDGIPQELSGVLEAMRKVTLVLMYRERSDAELNARRAVEALKTEHRAELDDAQRTAGSTLAMVEELEHLVSELDEKVQDANDEVSRWRQRAEALEAAAERLRTDHATERGALERQLDAVRRSEGAAVHAREEAVASAREEAARVRSLAEVLDRERQSRADADRTIADLRSALGRVEAEREVAREEVGVARQTAASADQRIQGLSDQLLAARERIAALEARVEVEHETAAQIAGVGEQIQLLADRLPNGVQRRKRRKADESP